MNLPPRPESSEEKTPTPIPAEEKPPSIVPTSIIEELLKSVKLIVDLHGMNQEQLKQQNESSEERKKRASLDRVRLAMWMIFVVVTLSLQIYAAEKGVHLVVPG